MNNRVAISANIMLGPEPEVPDDFVRQLRRADEFIVLATMAARQAVDTAPARELLQQESGIFIGTAYGPLSTNFQSLGSLIDDGEGQISPTLFSHSVFNAAGGYVARLLDFQGPACTITTFAWPFLAALQEGWLAVASGRVRRAVILGLEVYSELLRDALARSPILGSQEACEALTSGAVAWVLDPLEKEQDMPILEKIIVTEAPCDSSLLLTREGEAWEGLMPFDPQARTPLAHAQAMHGSLAGCVDGKVEWHFKAPFGEATLEFEKTSKTGVQVHERIDQ